MTPDLEFSSVANFEKIPPQNVEAEEAILGGILLDPEAISRVSDFLSPDAFYINAHRDIYKAALSLHQQRQPTDLMSVYSWLSDREWLERVGGQGKLAQLVERTVSAVNIDRYAMLVTEKYHRRQLIKLGNEVVTLGYDAFEDLDRQLDLIQGRLVELVGSRQAQQQSCQVLADILPGVISQIEKSNTGEDAEYTAIPTGLYDLDAITGGLPLGSLTVVAGRASMGKSTFALELALQSALGGLPTVYFSLEMTKPQMVRRILGRLSAPTLFGGQGIPTEKLFRRNALTHDDWGNLSAAIGDAGELPLWIQDNPSPTLASIRSDLRYVQATHGSVGMAIVDYVGLMRCGGANRVTELDYILSELRAIAKDLNIALVGLAQINRSVEGRQDKRPGLADIRESGAYENEAALLLGLYNDSHYNPNSPDQGIMETLVLKNRFGATGRCKLLFQPEYGRLLNLAHPHG